MCVCGGGGQNILCPPPLSKVGAMAASTCSDITALQPITGANPGFLKRGPSYSYVYKGGGVQLWAQC